jgi:hypothetical protein
MDFNAVESYVTSYFLFRPAVKNKHRSVAALTFVGNTSTQNITPLLLAKEQM